MNLSKTEDAMNWYMYIQIYDVLTHRFYYKWNTGTSGYHVVKIIQWHPNKSYHFYNFVRIALDSSFAMAFITTRLSSFSLWTGSILFSLAFRKLSLYETEHAWEPGPSAILALWFQVEAYQKFDIAFHWLMKKNSTRLTEKIIKAL